MYEPNFGLQKCITGGYNDEEGLLADFGDTGGYLDDTLLLGTEACEKYTGGLDFEPKAAQEDTHDEDDEFEQVCSGMDNMCIYKVPVENDDDDGYEDEEYDDEWLLSQNTKLLDTNEVDFGQYVYQHGTYFPRGLLQKIQELKSHGGIDDDGDVQMSEYAVEDAVCAAWGPFYTLEYSQTVGKYKARKPLYVLRHQEARTREILASKLPPDLFDRGVKRGRGDHDQLSYATRKVSTFSRQLKRVKVV